MINLKCKKYSFTLAEVIVVCSLFAVMVVWIIFAINRAFIFMDNTRLAVRASNLARWWVEMIYNLRDSNRRKYSWDKDKHWLDDWAEWTLWEWIYSIKDDWETENWDSYIYVEKLEDIDIDEFYTIEWFFSDDYTDQREASEIIFTGTYSYYSWWTLETGWNLSELLNVGGLTKFYRVLRVYGTVDKWSWWTSNKWPKPEELRFCVKVFYRNAQWQHASELCSIMTNFME